MERKGLGAGWVLLQDGDQLIVRASWAGHIVGIALLLGLGTALLVGIALGLLAFASGWRQAASGDAAIFLFGGLLGVFFLATGVKLLVDGEVACVLDKQSGTMQGIGSFRRKVVRRLDETTTNIEQYEWRTAFTVGVAFRVRLHPEVAVGGFSTSEAAEALASRVQEWLRKG
jgi:hypothetical protein